MALTAATFLLALLLGGAAFGAFGVSHEALASVNPGPGRPPRPVAAAADFLGFFSLMCTYEAMQR